MKRVVACGGIHKGERFRHCFLPAIKVAIDVQEPLTTRTFLRHPEPTLPVSGYAAAGGLVERLIVRQAFDSTVQAAVAS